MKVLLDKIKEASMSVLPIVAIVLVLLLTPFASLTSTELITFLVSTVFLILGIALFTLGADLAMTPMGSSVGSGLAKKRKLGLLLIISFLLGFLITIAEPDLKVLAGQVANVMNPTVLTVGIAFGVGLFIIIAIVRIIFKKGLSNILMLFYMVLFAIGMLVLINGNGDLLPLGFDSGGVTTGPITVPFLMALGVGIANILSGKNAKEDSFGIVALCSVGPILVVLLLSVFSKGSLDYKMPEYLISGDLFAAIVHKFFEVIKEVFLALGLVVASFLVINFIWLKQPWKHLKKIFVGIVYTFVG